ncbi:MAG: hypothetical protein JNL28_15670 [Planctomycetes bacterium]|nr:hypothetical protein [Planctomycetota bacterium]
MMKLDWKPAGALLLGALSCTTAVDNRLPKEAERVLIGATSLELMALDPTPLALTPGDARAADQLHGYAITGRARLTDPQRCTEVADLILRAVRESDGRAAACFNPRHGIRAVYEGRTLELVICFECLSMQVFGDALGASGAQQNVLISNSGEGSINRIFKGEGLAVSGQ